MAYRTIKPPKRQGRVIALPPLSSTPTPQLKLPSNAESAMQASMEGQGRDAAKQAMQQEAKTSRAEARAQQKAEKVRIRRELILDAGGPEVVLPGPLDLVYDSITPAFGHPIVGMTWSRDGTILTTYSGTHKSYSVGAPFSLTDGFTLLGSITLTNTQGGGEGCSWSEDGLTFYSCSDFADRVSQWTVATPFRVDTTITPTVSDANYYLYQSKQITVFNNGTRLQTLSDTNGSFVHVYELTTAYDIASKVLLYSYNGLQNLQYRATSDHPLGSGAWQNGYVMADDGTYALSVNNGALGPIWFHPLVTPYSPGTSDTKVADDYNFNLSYASPTHLHIPPGEKILFVARNQHRTIEKYTWT